MKQKSSTYFMLYKNSWNKCFCLSYNPSVLSPLTLRSHLPVLPLVLTLRKSPGEPVCLLLRGAELSKRMPFVSCATPDFFQFWSFETLCLFLFSFHFYNKYSLHAQSCSESFAFLNVVDTWSVCFYSNTSWIQSSLDNLKITALF